MAVANLQNTERTAFDDEAELKRERKAKRAAEEQERMRGVLHCFTAGFGNPWVCGAVTRLSTVTIPSRLSALALALHIIASLPALLGARRPTSLPA